MRRRERTALNLTPLCLRLPLALIFIWAGLGKVVGESQISADQALILQAHGISVAGAPTADPTPSPETPAGAETAPDPTPEVQPDPTSETPVAPLPDPDPEPAAPEPAQPEDEDPIAETPPAQTVQANHGPRITLVQDADQAPPATYTVRSVYQIVLVLENAANPLARADGSIPPSTWPPALAKKPWTQILAWAVALTELFAGFFLLIGLITRLSALSLVGVMLGAIWLATLTPAIQSTDPFLGFLPNEPFLSFFWKDPFWQLLCLMASLALFFAGPGALALDRAIFAPSSATDWDDDDDDAHRDRSSFDRAP